MKITESRTIDAPLERVFTLDSSPIRLATFPPAQVIKIETLPEN